MLFSESMATSATIDLRILNDTVIGLGYLYSSIKGLSSFVEGVKQAYIDEHTSKGFIQSQETKKELVTSSEKEVMTLVGTLDINAKLYAAQINGKAHLNLKNEGQTESAQVVFTSYAVERRETMHVEDLAPDHFIRKFDDYTHVVTEVLYGKFLYGEIKLQSKLEVQELAAGGSLQVKILRIPIGGKGSIDYGQTDIKENYLFSANLTAKGQPFDEGLLTISDLNDFNNSVDKFMKEEIDPGECVTIVKVKMEPLGGLLKLNLNIPDISYNTCVDKAKQSYLDMKDLVSYIKNRLTPFLDQQGGGESLDIIRRKVAKLNRDVQKKMSELQSALENCRSSKDMENLKLLTDDCYYFTVDNWVFIEGYEVVDSFIRVNNVTVSEVNCVRVGHIVLLRCFTGGSIETSGGKPDGVGGSPDFGIWQRWKITSNNKKDGEIINYLEEIFFCSFQTNRYLQATDSFGENVRAHGDTRNSWGRFCFHRKDDYNTRGQVKFYESVFIRSIERNLHVQLENSKAMCKTINLNQGYWEEFMIRRI